jgi:hypothetical protein
LEQLISFELLDDNGKFLQLRDRFLRLENLLLYCGNDFSLPPQGAALKELKSLELMNYDFVDLSGLKSLTSLTLRWVSILLGQEEIFPQLRKLYFDKYFHPKDCSKYPQLTELVYEDPADDLTVEQLNQCLTIPVVHIYNYEQSLRFSEEDLLIGEKVKELQLTGVHFRSFQGVSPDRYFHEIVLRSIYSLQDLSVFQKAQKISLWNCSSISDITPIRDVPYLVFMGCNEIRDYSC